MCAASVNYALVHMKCLLYESKCNWVLHNNFSMVKTYKLSLLHNLIIHDVPISLHLACSLFGSKSIERLSLIAIFAV